MTTTLTHHDDYVAFCEGVRQLCSVDLLQYRRGQMERRIRTFAERRGTSRLAEYLFLLRKGPGELEQFLDRMTINVSQLWRNPEQWTRLEREVLPELAATGRIRAWSAGSSYGAEAYSLAALCLQAAPGARVSVHGTDIDGRMVAQAREGRFSADDARTAPAATLGRWFDAVEGGWQAKAELRRVVSFETGDLLRMPFPRASYDLVLCRNTVIYFTDDVRDALHARLAETLRPGGYLLVGSTERVSQPMNIELESTLPFFYRKR
jgi:chemotaxis protein methyltransferase CheR